MIGNIMIVDDSPVDRKIICQILKNKLNNVKVFELDKGVDISKSLLDKEIHVCILDIMMPEKNGIEVLKEMKEDISLMDVPVIVCTGTEDKQVIEKVLTLGAYDYFSKPLTEEEMKISLPLKVKNAIDLMKRKEEIVYLSYHDKLTGLYNRRFAEEELKRLDIERNLPLSLIMGDVNGLKLVNDAFGHEEGDRLLKKVAAILKNECREGEIIARVGGDEFLIVLPNTNEVDTEKILQRIDKKCKLEEDDPIKPSISLGFATKKSKGQDINFVYKEAEKRMYSAKLLESKNIRTHIIETLRKALHDHSSETDAHSSRLVELSQNVGKAMGLSKHQIQSLELVALLHDIGMTAIPYCILNKKDALNLEEEDIMKNHSEIGYRIAGASPDLAHIAGDILSHHERWDGQGYPQGIEGEKIPLNARIITVLDAFDTMTNEGFNQQTVSIDEALIFIEEEAGKSFDPQVVAKFLEVIGYKATSE